MEHKPVLIVCTDPTLFGALDDAYEDVNRYVAKIISGRYTLERAMEVEQTLRQNKHISTVITRGIWYNRLLEMDFLRQNPQIRGEQMVIDMRTCLQELNELYSCGYQRIGIITINSPFGVDPPTDEELLLISGIKAKCICIQDLTNPMVQIQALIEEQNIDVLWGDVADFEDEKLCRIPRYTFGVRGKALSAMLRNAADYAAAQEMRLHNEKLMGFLNTMTNIVSEGVLMFKEDGAIFAANNNFIIASLKHQELVGQKVQEVIGISLEEIMELPANALIRIDRHSYIANLLRLHEPNPQYALVINSAGQISSYDLSVRTQITKEKFPARYSFKDIIAVAPLSRHTLETAQAYAGFEETVLISGETGTGKELFASSIHRASVRNSKPFVAINCATFSESLIDSELFGYEKGAFTGALSSGKKGLFEMAHRGTIFLDEISEMPLHLQTKLLRVLQEKTLMRIGGNEIIPIDVHIIAATNKNLLDQCHKGLFRYDLYYRLALLELNLHPLRERRADIIPLFQHFLQKDMRRSGRKIYWESDEIFECLQRYPWHGNIRELENTALRTIILAKELRLTKNDIQNALPSNYASSWAQSGQTLFSCKLTDDLSELERDYVSYLMTLMNNNRDEVCNYLHISKPTLWRKLNYARTDNVESKK